MIIKIIAEDFKGMMSGVKETVEEFGEYDAMQVMRLDSEWTAIVVFEDDEIIH